MDFATTIRILLSRWYVVLPSLALTAAAAFFATQAVTPSFESSGSMVLLGPAIGAPTSGEKPPQVNAYLEFGGTLETTAEVLSRATLSDATAKRLRAAGATAEYEVGTGSDGGSPIINIVATGTSPGAARKTVIAIERELARQLQARQVAAKAPREQFIRMERVAPPTEPKELLGSKLRAAAAAAALGVALTFSLAFLVKGITERRNRRGWLRDEVGRPARLPPPMAAMGGTPAGRIPGAQPSANPPSSSPGSATSVARSTPRRW